MTMEDAAAYKLKLKEALAAEGKEELVNEDAFEDLTDVSRNPNDQDTDKIVGKPRFHLRYLISIRCLYNREL